MTSRYYPAMLRVEGRRCVVVGGGGVAGRKTRGLLEAGADVLVVSPALSEELQTMEAAGFIRAVRREYREQDLDGAMLAVAATSDRDVNARVVRDGRRLGVLVNAADDAADGAFVTPAVVRRGPLLLAVSASGASPLLAARIARQLAERYDESYGEFAAWLGRLRRAAETELADDREARRRVLRAALDAPREEWSQDTDHERLKATIRRLLTRTDGGMNDE